MDIKKQANDLASRIYTKKSQVESAYHAANKFIDYLDENYIDEGYSIAFALEDIPVGNLIQEKIDENHKEILSLIESLLKGKQLNYEDDQRILDIIEHNKKLFAALNRLNVNL